MKYTVNELTIDDSMFSYSSRTTRFINSESYWIGRGSQPDWYGHFGEKDILYGFYTMVDSDSKFLKRTRRKFWDDVSLRGGQYSAVMILLTAIYSLFQGPF